MRSHRFSSPHLLDVEVKVLENRRITSELFVISFAHAKLAQRVQPGQFFQIQVLDQWDPLLRRPFTVYRVRGKVIEILYEIVGCGSQILSEKKRGDTLKVMGPLGNTFTMDKKKRIRVIIGGGVGIAPFLFLAQRIRIDHFIMGARTRAGILPKEELRGLPLKTSIATEDGSLGKKGLVTACVEDLIRETDDPRQLYFHICGPRAMMRALIELARRYGIQGEASVDERMACGVGACLGCVVPTRQGYRTSCVDGTVFKFEDLVL